MQQPPNVSCFRKSNMLSDSQKVAIAKDDVTWM